MQPDAGSDDTALTAPSIDTSTPMRVPGSTVAIRGSTSGARIVVKTSAGDPVEQAALPTGGFCIDVPLNANGPTTLDVYALKDGLISPAAEIVVTQDPGAPQPASPLCLGAEVPQVTPENPGSGDCSDGKDNDGNGLVDACDPGCNMCVDDALGPNNSPFFVPTVAPGSYDLQICPCTADWFAFTVPAGGIVHAKATFDSSKVDFDMMLQTPNQAETNSTFRQAISNGTTGTEEINYTATNAGTFYLKVYPFASDGTGAYTLTIY